MTSFIKVPIAFDDSTSALERSVSDHKKMLDNYIDLIVFTPRGSFEADPDFGFEYWNHEYANLQYREFNSGQNSHTSQSGGIHDEVTRLECEDSIRNSILSYEPMLKHVDVQIELQLVSAEHADKNSSMSRYRINVCVVGAFEDGLGTLTPYKRQLSFMVEPTAKHHH